MSEKNNLYKKVSKNINGSALAYGLVIMTVVMIILTSIISYITSQLKFTANRLEREKAFQIAESGAYYYRWYLAHATDGMNPQQLRSFWTNSSTIGVSGDYQADYKDPETQEVVGHYSLHLVPPTSYSTIATITSTGYTLQMPNVKRKIMVRFRRPSWSEYIYLVHGFVRFGVGAEVYGKVHSNTGVEFNGLAHNVVSSAVPVCSDTSNCSQDFGVFTNVSPADPNAPTSAYPWPDGTVPNRPDVFQGGRQFPVPDVSFNGMRTNLDDMKSLATSSGTNINNCTTTGCYFDSSYPRRIILSNNNMIVCQVRSYDTTSLMIASSNGYRKVSGSGSCNSCSGLCATSYTIPDNGIVFVENNAWVDGTISNKKVTITAANLGTSGSAANIYLGISNLRYADYSGNSILGIVGQQNVQIVRDCPSNTIIDGALIAQAQNNIGKVFRDSGAYSSSYDKNSLIINGSIASYEQPYFNVGSRGFTTRTYNFDNNLLYFPPPYFPTGTEYAIDRWEEL